MGGVVAGTAILAPTATGCLHTVTLTINNNCNLSCPHCYLNYSGTDVVISEQVLDYLWRSEFQHLAIVGMEPLLNRKCADLVDNIAARALADNKTTSVITNGVNLCLLSESALQHLHFIDISLDGGEATYESYRKGSLAKIRLGLDHLRKHSFTQFNALETLNEVTKNYIDDMMSFTQDHGFAIVLFSPFVPTLSGRNYAVDCMTLQESLRYLSASNRFMDDPRSQILIDTYHCAFEGISMFQARIIAHSLEMEHKVRFVTTDPTLLGVMRLTYDGLVLSSFDALNTSMYDRYGVPVQTYPNLNDHFQNISDHFVLRQAA